MRQTESKTSIGNIAVLLVFCILALCLLMTLLMGARVYRSVTARAEEAGNQRTASQYVANRIRQADGEGAISVEDFGGTSALTLRESIGDSEYLTRIYCHEGWLRELYAAEDSNLTPEDGEPLVRVSDLAFLLEDGRLTVQVEHADGSSQTLTLALRSGEVVLP